MRYHTEYLCSLANILQMLKDRQSIVETVLCTKPISTAYGIPLLWEIVLAAASQQFKGTGAEGHRGTGTAF